MADPARRPRDRAPRSQFDMSLLAALLDRWRPETHTFHLPVGEMTPTLQDVAMLLRLPCAGRAVGAEDVGLSWRDDLLARFAGVQRNELAFAVPALACEPRTRTDKEVAPTVQCEYLNVESFRIYGRT